MFLLQASRDEGYEVDEGLAEQDAASLFEVCSQTGAVLNNSSKLRANAS